MIKKFTQLIVLSFSCLLILINSYGQGFEDIKVTAQFSNKSIGDILNEIDLKYSFSIYFDATAIGDATYSYKFDQEYLSEVLSQILQPTQLGFMYYRSYAIIIAGKEELSQYYTADYYKALEQRLKEPEEPSKESGIQLLAGDKDFLKASGEARVKGNIRDKSTREYIVGATIFVKELNLAVSTDNEGEFDLRVPIGKYSLEVRYVGYDQMNATLKVYGDDNLHIEIEKEAITLDEVVIGATSPDANVSSVLIGVEKLSVEAIKKLPAFLGEADIIKSITLLPGVSTVGEGASGFNVRGGQVDQNLVLYDEAIAFNTSHALGFFSTFNTDIIKNVTLYKGTIPAQYGGRLSSVLDVEMRDGDAAQYKISGGIGSVSSRLAIEGPIKQEKSSFLVGGRVNYSDWMLKQIKEPSVQNSSVFFYDLNARLTQRIGENSKLSLGAYSSYDMVNFANDFSFDYKTDSYQLNFKNSINSRFSSSLSVIYSMYDANLKEPDVSTAFNLNTGITYCKINELLKYQVNDDMSFTFGGMFLSYLVNPGKKEPIGDDSQIDEIELEEDKGREYAIFVNDEWTVSDKLSFSLGIRYNMFQNIGSATNFTYSDDKFPSEESITGTTTYQKGEVIATYRTFEPRISANIKASPDVSFKLGYSKTSQFIHQVSNTSSVTPVDVWQLSNSFVKPELADNFSLGVFKNFKENLWETSMEIYYRSSSQLLEYRDFADLLANDHLETELRSAEGRAYGMEISIKRKAGIWNGWLSYTLSRSERRVTNENPDFEISYGNWFPSNYDKTHDVSFVSNFKINKRHQLNINFSYTTGRPTTAPVGSFRVGDAVSIPLYSDRNAIRIPDYHRLDFSYTLDQGYKKDRKFKTSWTFALYNVYARKNAYSVYYTQRPYQRIEAKQLSILGSIFPSVTINFVWK